MSTDNLRIGQGYDIHAFAEGRKLVLGGVEIQHHKGLKGHSDADVVLHAVCDALLGAIGDSDIGHHFPPSDARWKDVSSLTLLQIVMQKVTQANFSVINCDISVLAEEPKLSPYIEQIRSNIAAVLQITKDRVAIKATTNEKLGSIGRSEGIAALAVVLVVSDN